MSTSDDEFRDPTAPPPLRDREEPEAPEDAPGSDDTQVVGAGSTQAIDAPPAGPPAAPPPAYPPPSYAQPSYSLPSYESPTPDPAPGSSTPGPGQPPPPPWAQPAGENPYGAPPAQPPGVPPYQAAPAPPPYGAAGGVPASPYASAPSPYGGPPRNTSALVLTIVSGISIVFCGGLLAIPALVFGIMGLTRQSTDPAGSARMARLGWWAYVIGIVVTVLIAVAFFAMFAMAGSSSSEFGGY